MGCGSSDTASPVLINTTSTAATVTITTDFAVIVQQVKQTWPDIRKVDKLGAKVFAHLLHKYPELRSCYHVPEAYKTEAELYNADEVQQAGDKFIGLYSDIIENSDTKFDEIIHEKANELYQQGIRINQVKYLGESLVHVIQYTFQNDFTTDEKQCWQVFNNQVSNGLASALTRFPRRSIFA